MKNVLLALLHLAVMTAKLCGPGGVRAVIAENLVLKQQLLVLEGRARFPLRSPSRGKKARLRFTGPQPVVFLIGSLFFTIPFVRLFLGKGDVARGVRGLSAG
jgi:hypothetical protein